MVKTDSTCFDSTIKYKWCQNAINIHICCYQLCFKLFYCIQNLKCLQFFVSKKVMRDPGMKFNKYSTTFKCMNSDYTDTSPRKHFNFFLYWVVSFFLDHSWWCLGHQESLVLGPEWPHGVQGIEPGSIVYKTNS